MPFMVEDLRGPDGSRKLTLSAALAETEDREVGRGFLHFEVGVGRCCGSGVGVAGGQGLSLVSDGSFDEVEELRLHVPPVPVYR